MFKKFILVFNINPFFFYLLFFFPYKLNILTIYQSEFTEFCFLKPVSVEKIRDYFSCEFFLYKLVRHICQEHIVLPTLLLECLIHRMEGTFISSLCRETLFVVWWYNFNGWKGTKIVFYGENNWEDTFLFLKLKYSK